MRRRLVRGPTASPLAGADGDPYDRYMNISSDAQVSVAAGTAPTEPLVHPEDVARASSRLPDAGAVADLADVLDLLGEPHRLTLLLALRDVELCVHDLAVTIGQSESATSHALKLLRSHRIVRARKEGRRVYYRLDDPHVRMLLEVALTHTEHSALQHPERAGSPRGGAGSAAP